MLLNAWHWSINVYNNTIFVSSDSPFWSKCLPTCNEKAYMLFWKIATQINLERKYSCAHTWSYAPLTNKNRKKSKWLYYTSVESLLYGVFLIYLLLFKSLENKSIVFIWYLIIWSDFVLYPYQSWKIRDYPKSR